MKIFFKQSAEERIRTCSQQALLDELAPQQGLIGFCEQSETECFFYHFRDKSTGQSELRRYPIRMTTKTISPYYEVFKPDQNDFTELQNDPQPPRINLRKYSFLTSSEKEHIKNQLEDEQKNRQEAFYLPTLDLSRLQQETLLNGVVVSGLGISFYHFLAEYILPLPHAETILKAAISSDHHRERLLAEIKDEHAHKALSTLLYNFLAPSQIRNFMNLNASKDKNDNPPKIVDAHAFLTHCIQTILTQHEFKTVPEDQLLKLNEKTNAIRIGDQKHIFNDQEIHNPLGLSGTESIIFRFIILIIGPENRNIENITNIIKNHKDFRENIIPIYRAITDLIKAVNQDTATSIISNLSIYDNIDAVIPREQWAALREILIIAKESIESLISIQESVMHNILMEEGDRIYLLSDVNGMDSYLKAIENTSPNSNQTKWLQKIPLSRLKALYANDTLTEATFRICRNRRLFDRSHIEFDDFMMSLLILKNINLLSNPLIMSCLEKVNFTSTNNSADRTNYASAIAHIAPIFRDPNIPVHFQEKIINYLIAHHFDNVIIAKAINELLSKNLFDESLFNCMTKATNPLDYTQAIAIINDLNPKLINHPIISENLIESMCPSNFALECINLDNNNHLNNETIDFLFEFVERHQGVGTVSDIIAIAKEIDFPLSTIRNYLNDVIRNSSSDQISYFINCLNILFEKTLLNKDSLSILFNSPNAHSVFRIINRLSDIINLDHKLLYAVINHPNPEKIDKIFNELHSLGTKNPKIFLNVLFYQYDHAALSRRISSLPSRQISDYINDFFEAIPKEKKQIQRFIESLDKSGQLSNDSVRYLMRCENPRLFVEKLTAQSNTTHGSWCAFIPRSFKPIIGCIVDEYNQHKGLMSESAESLFKNCNTYEQAATALSDKIKEKCHRHTDKNKIQNSAAYKTLLGIGNYTKKELDRLIDQHSNATNMKISR